MIEVKYPDKQMQNYKIIWENDWLAKIENLPEGKFLVFDKEDTLFFDRACFNEEWELVFLIDYKTKQILKIRSLSPCIYTEEFQTIEITDEMKKEIDKRIQDKYNEMPAHLAEVTKMTDLLKKFFPDE